MNVRYEDNEAISEHIWKVIVQGEEVNAVERANAEKEHLPRLHTDWLSPQEVATRDSQGVDKKLDIE